MPAAPPLLVLGLEQSFAKGQKGGNEVTHKSFFLVFLNFGISLKISAPSCSYHLFFVFFNQADDVVRKLTFTNCSAESQRDEEILNFWHFRDQCTPLYPSNID